MSRRISTAAAEPFSAPEAEAALVGACLIDPQALDLCTDAAVNAQWFTEAAPRAVWQAVASLRDQQLPVDAVTVSVALRESGGLAMVGGAEKLRAMADAAIAAVYVDSYIADVRDMWRRRTIRAALMTGASRLSDAQYSADALAGEIAAAVTAVSETAAGKNEGTFPQALDAGVELWERTARGETIGLQTGIDWIDAAVGGLAPGSIMVVSGPPGSSKTTLARMIIEGVGRAGHKPAFRTLEQTREQIAQGMLAANAGACVSDLNVPVTPETAARRDVTMRHIRASRDMLATWDMSLVDGPDTISGFRCWCYKQVRAGSKLICVDYLQRLLQDGGREVLNDEQRITAASTVCYEIARKTGVPFVVVVSESRAGKVRYSSAVEFDAHTWLRIRKTTEEDGNGPFDPFENPLYRCSWEKSRFAPGGHEVLLCWSKSRLIPRAEWERERAARLNRNTASEPRHGCGGSQPRQEVVNASDMPFDE